MKRICIVTGSPRAGGSSDTAAGLIAEVLTESGLCVETIHTREAIIRPCISCGYCDNHPGICPLDGTPGMTPHGKHGNDTAGLLLRHIINAESVIIALPVYFYGPPAHLKALMDRAQRYWKVRDKPDVTNVADVAHQKATSDKTDDLSLLHRPIRPALAIMCAARTHGDLLFDANTLILRCFLRTLGFSLNPPFLLRGIESPEDLLRTDTIVSDIHSYARTMLKTLLP